jgi:hypothetical protein
MNTHLVAKFPALIEQKILLHAQILMLYQFSKSQSVERLGYGLDGQKVMVRFPAVSGDLSLPDGVQT